MGHTRQTENRLASRPKMGIHVESEYWQEPSEFHSLHTVVGILR